MTAALDALRFLNVVSAAIVAGGQLFCLLAVLPAMPGWPAEMSVRVHQDALTHRPHRYLRVTASITVLTGAALLAIVLVEDENAVARGFTAIGFSLALVSGAISSREWPINDEIDAWADDPQLERYGELRRIWDRRHVIRTWASIGALASFMLAIVLTEHA